MWAPGNSLSDGVIRTIEYFGELLSDKGCGVCGSVDVIGNGEARTCAGYEDEGFYCGARAALTWRA